MVPDVDSGHNTEAEMSSAPLEQKAPYVEVTAPRDSARASLMNDGHWPVRLHEPSLQPSADASVSARDPKKSLVQELVSKVIS